MTTPCPLPQKIGPYQLVRPLGSGTVGTAYLAQGDGSKFAVVKRLSDALAQDKTLSDKFLAAWQISSQIKNRRFVAAVLMQKSAPEGVFLVREYVEGCSLAELAQSNKLAELNLKQVTCDLCDAVRALAQRKLVHGGLHPANVIIQPSGRAMIADFAISQAALTGTITPAYPLAALRYLAPEQIRGQPAGPASDIYAVALLLALVQQQREIIPGTSWEAVKKAILAGASVSSATLQRALRSDPGQRFDSIEQLRHILLAEWDAVAQTPKASPPPKGQAAQEPAREELPSRPVPQPAQKGPLGVLSALTAFPGDEDLLALNHGQPWQIIRNGRLQQRALFLTNGGPGDLQLTIQHQGQGISVTPHSQLRIPAGRVRYVVLHLEPHGSDFAKLELRWPNQRPSQRVDIRIYRPHR